jgi:hypothetical protein
MTALPPESSFLNRAVQEEHDATRVIATRSSLVLQLATLEQRMGQILEDKTTRIDEDYRNFDIGAEKNASLQICDVAFRYGTVPYGTGTGTVQVL